MCFHWCQNLEWGDGWEGGRESGGVERRFKGLHTPC